MHGTITDVTAKAHTQATLCSLHLCSIYWHFCRRKSSCVCSRSS